jgi:8-oxo-dGTP pyrophosphatase MutT (NUDIX family)
MREQLRAALTAYEPQRLDDRDSAPNVRPAAVLVLFYERNGEPHVVFQKRTETVEAHKGQISLPGGAADPEDTDLRFTALRETHEEVGVHPDDVDILGQLDDLLTISNFVVTPFVGWLNRPQAEWTFSEHEVAYLLEVPFSHLLDEANHVSDRRMMRGKEHTFPAYQFGDDLIWGATARMMSNLLDIFATIP